MKKWGIAALAAVLAGAPAFAQDVSDNRVGQDTDWSVFMEEDPQHCWAVSTPVESVATRDGRQVSVQRSEILMYVSFWPGQERMGEVSFTGGYPFSDGSTVSVEIGGQTYQLFTEGENAWASSSQDDAALIVAMQRGSDAVVTGLSSRGTTTQDTISLLGFTNAVADARERCGG